MILSLNMKFGMYIELHLPNIMYFLEHFETLDMFFTWQFRPKVSFTQYFPIFIFFFYLTFGDNYDHASS
jgi:hypothetical protein